VLLPGIYWIHTGPPPREVALDAARLYAGADAVLSHWTAAELWGFRCERTPEVHNRPVDHSGYERARQTRRTSVSQRSTRASHALGQKGVVGRAHVGRRRCGYEVTSRGTCGHSRRRTARPDSAQAHR
jgi:hypothetical protein